jgi:hypothetical protein
MLYVYQMLDSMRNCAFGKFEQQMGFLLLILTKVSKVTSSRRI